MRSRNLARSLALFTCVLLLAGCGETGDKQIERKVVNTWTSEGMPVAEVKAAGSKAEFDKRFWGGLETLTIGDCVKVWMWGSSQLIYGRRDLAPCDKK